jgi:hypothetical protein
VHKSLPANRIEIRGLHGKLRGVIENRVLRKEIRGSLHLLRKPPAIALDARMYDRYRPHFDEIAITDTETGTVYRAGASYFDRRRLVIERGYGKQYALLLSCWSVERPNDPQLRLEVG